MHELRRYTEHGATPNQGIGMKPSGRRRVERAIRKIMQDDGDRCSVCKKPFDHNIKTFGGVLAGGVPALVTECCVAKLKEVILQGAYVNRNYEHLAGKGPPGEGLPPTEIPGAVERIREHFAAGDKFGSEIAKRGGMPMATPRLHTADSAWKADDAEWFKAHGERAHRLRPAFPGEFDPSALPALPPGHEYQALVRQVAPGQRIRNAFARNTEVPIPDVEEVLHALFDIAAGGHQGVVTSGQVAELASRYAVRKRSRQA